jgi:hypothetical protein
VELQGVLDLFYDRVSQAEAAEPQPTYVLSGGNGLHYLAKGFTCLAG